MAIDDETFFAWLDGELGAAQAAEVEAQVEDDPRLMRMAKQHRGFGARLRETFATVSAAPVPKRLASAVEAPSAKIIDIGSRTQRKSMAQLPQWAAMAATLVIGVLIGTTLIGERGGSPVDVREGTMVAAAGLDRALDQQLASAGDVAGLRIGVTFRDSTGAVCRSFTDQRSSGLACRAGNDWRVKGLFAAPQAPGGDYRMAGGADPNLAALIDSTIAGDAFDAAQEKSAQARGWR
ncbi:MAG: hypothetical protein ABIT68_05355 [Sphingomicrobium sp.]